MRMARARLKIAQMDQKSVVRVGEWGGSLRQVRKRGAQGMRKRASWWGIMERVRVAEMAEMRRGLRNVALRCRKVRWEGE